MHRSGTSIVAGILAKLGVDMGRDLLGANYSNPTGHFENKKFIQLNNKILKSAGGGWDFPPSEEKILVQRRKFENEIKKIIVEEGKLLIWGWKDPRTSLTIELYLPFLKNPYFLVCHRDNLEIANSLNKRDGLEIKQGLELTKIYNQRINEFFEKYPKLRKMDLFYEEVINNSKKWIKKIFDFLEIEPTKESCQRAVDFVLPKEKVQELSRKMRATKKRKKIKKAILNPWKVLRYIYKKITKQ